MVKWYIGIALLGCAIVWALPGAAADPKDKNGGLEDADLKAVLEFNAKVVQDALGDDKTKVTEVLKRKATSAARMIALAAQSGGKARNFGGRRARLGRLPRSSCRPCAASG